MMVVYEGVQQMFSRLLTLCIAKPDPEEVMSDVTHRNGSMVAGTGRTAPDLLSTSDQRHFQLSSNDRPKVFRFSQEVQN